ncbi:MAG: hypothetical protein FJZ57_06290 [Chlamydiae bacterium]|nr:hypothetical protein [Chlamydiota bacterium]
MVNLIRNQVEIIVASLDELVLQDHKVRLVWKYIKKIDLSEFLIKINTVEGAKGRPAINPRVLLSIWLYATLEGICHE